MRVCTLASSSKGNSTLIYTSNGAILVDIGITLCEIERKLEKLRIEPSFISAILITHEHSDHIKGVGAFSRKYGTKIYCHIDASNSLRGKLGKVKDENFICFSDFPFDILDFTIQAFKIPHDVPCCVGYNIFWNNKKVSILTDLGYADESIVSYLYNSKIVILEANHDEKKLIANPKYSFMLKQRILGKQGHLSNIACAKIICELAMNNVTQVLLAHLSEENNTPQLSFNTVCDYLLASGIEPGVNIKIDVAGANTMGPIFHIK